MVWFWNPFGAPLHMHMDPCTCPLVKFCSGFPVLQTALPVLPSTTQSPGAAPVILQASSIYTQGWDSSWAFKLNNPSLLSLSSNNNLSIIVIHCRTHFNMSMFAQNCTQHSTHAWSHPCWAEGRINPLGLLAPLCLLQTTAPQVTGLQLGLSYALWTVSFSPFSVHFSVYWSSDVPILLDNKLYNKFSGLANAENDAMLRKLTRRICIMTIKFLMGQNQSLLQVK